LGVGDAGTSTGSSFCKSDEEPKAGAEDDVRLSRTVIGPRRVEHFHDWSRVHRGWGACTRWSNEALERRKPELEERLFLHRVEDLFALAFVFFCGDQTIVAETSEFADGLSSVVLWSLHTFA
jgi:hypothetical protein